MKFSVSLAEGLARSWLVNTVMRYEVSYISRYGFAIFPHTDGIIELPATVNHCHLFTTTPHAIRACALMRIEFFGAPIIDLLHEVVCRLLEGYHAVTFHLWAKKLPMINFVQQVPLP